MKDYFKENGAFYTAILTIFFIAGVVIGILIADVRAQKDRVDELERQNNEMYYELIVTKDQLTQIQMRNEAIKYIDELEE